jgi:hypothetical protein
MGCSIQPIPFLSKYDCHIKVDICNSVSSVQYLYKYIYKGHDRAILESGEDIDKIKQCLEGRYISTCPLVIHVGGFWDLKQMVLVTTFVRLSVHLPNQQHVTFHAARPIERALHNNEETMLTEFFKVNLDIQQSIQMVLPHKVSSSCQFSEHYAWNQRTKTWARRQRAWKVVACMTMAPPGTEKFYHRMLLNHVRGPKYFNDLKTQYVSVAITSFNLSCLNI